MTSGLVTDVALDIFERKQLFSGYVASREIEIAPSPGYETSGVYEFRCNNFEVWTAYIMLKYFMCF